MKGETCFHLPESQLYEIVFTVAVKEPKKAVSPDPAVAESKPEEPKEAPPAPDTSGPTTDGVAPEGEYRNK